MSKKTNSHLIKFRRIILQTKQVANQLELKDYHYTNHLYQAQNKKFHILKNLQGSDTNEDEIVKSLRK